MSHEFDITKNHNYYKISLLGLNRSKLFLFNNNKDNWKMEEQFNQTEELGFSENLK